MNQPEALRLADRNGSLIQQLRRTPVPLADLIPHLQAMGDELRRLHEENESLRKDAERYRWLRIQNDEDFCFAVVENSHFDLYDSPEALDSAIDAAMKGQS